MVKKCWFWTIIIFGSSLSVFGQTYKEPEPLDSLINSESEESFPLISLDGETLYFVRSFHKNNKGGQFAGQDIWLSRLDSGRWAAPTNNLGVLNNKKNNAVIGMGQDGNTLYLLDNYGNSQGGIAFTRYYNGKWTKPERIPIRGLDKTGYMGFYMNPAFDVLLISMQGNNSYGEEDLFISFKDSTKNWSEPRNIGPTINTSSYEISPYLSADKKRLYFASGGHSGFGDADIFVSERLYNSWDVWSVPENLGPVINSPKFDAYYNIGQDSTIYFSSNRNSDFANIFTSKIVSEKTNVSQQRIDSLIKQAKSILVELQSMRGRNTTELILDFEYNSFILSDDDKEEILNILKEVEDKSLFIIQLNSFSYEDYSEQAKRLIISKREQSIRDFFTENGIPSVNIISEQSAENAFNDLSENGIGGVNIKMSY